jgi:hypothetical protein
MWVDHQSSSSSSSSVTGMNKIHQDICTEPKPGDVEALYIRDTSSQTVVYSSLINLQGL